MQVITSAPPQLFCHEHEPSPEGFVAARAGGIGGLWTSALEYVDGLPSSAYTEVGLLARDSGTEERRSRWILEPVPDARVLVLDSRRDLIDALAAYGRVSLLGRRNPALDPQRMAADVDAWMVTQAGLDEGRDVLYALGIPSTQWLRWAFGTPRLVMEPDEHLAAMRRAERRMDWPAYQAERRRRWLGPQRYWRRTIPPVGAIPAGIYRSDNPKELLLREHEERRGIAATAAYAQLVDEQVRELASRDDALAVEAHVDGFVVGCLIAVGTDEAVWLEGGYVEPPYRRRGIGRAMVDAIAAVTHGRFRTMYCSTGDARAVAFVEALGFVEVAEPVDTIAAALSMPVRPQQ